MLKDEFNNFSICKVKSPCFFGHSFPFVGIHNIAVLAGQSLGRRKICLAILDFRFLLLCLVSGILEYRISSSIISDVVTVRHLQYSMQASLLKDIHLLCDS